MNKTRKLASLLLALVMVLGMVGSAMAATVTNETEHSYDAYQIFAGTQAENDVALGNVQWGSGVDSASLLEELKKLTAYETCNSAADVAVVLAASADNSETAKTFANIAAKHLSSTKVAIDAGATSVNLEAGYYLLVDSTTLGEYDAKNAALLQVTNKGPITISKKYDVPEIDKIVDKEDVNIGDTVTFTLTATMPDTFEGYDSYKVVFHDTLSAGLDFVEDTVKVMIGDKDVSESFDSNESNGTLTISCDDILAEAVGATPDCTIVVTYDAYLDDDAVIGSEGNPNEVYLEYSNDPNWNGEGDEPTGDTPEDEVKVYTWEIPVFKYTGTDTPLAGAGFTLYTDEACTKAVNLVATKDSTIYKVCTQTECADHTHVTEIVTGETGKFEIEGLEKGTYYLKETTTPAGYNTVANTTVVIGENGALTQNGEATDDVGILNQKGSTLPETGGIGTTLFYIAGTILVVGALVLMITKRRVTEK